MENDVKMEAKKTCCCTATIGLLVIVFAWWKVGWGSIALTILGAAIILKQLTNCCCRGSVCKPKA